MSKAHVNLAPSEAVCVQVAGQIYAAYIAAGRVVEGEEDKWMERSIRESIRIALTADKVIIAEEEMP